MNTSREGFYFSGVAYLLKRLATFIFHVSWLASFYKVWQHSDITRMEFNERVINGVKTVDVGARNLWKGFRLKNWKRGWRSGRWKWGDIRSKELHRTEWRTSGLKTIVGIRFSLDVIVWRAADGSMRKLVFDYFAEGENSLTAPLIVLRKLHRGKSVRIVLWNQVYIRLDFILSKEFELHANVLLKNSLNSGKIFSR